MTPVHRPFPGADLRVSPICLGTMTFGNPVGESEAAKIVAWALDHGINFFDTADIYEGYDRFVGSAGGTSEKILGAALRSRRHRAVITSKVGMVVGNGPYEGQGLGRRHILHQIDASLARLGTDHVDLYLMHKPDPETPLAESIAVMVDLIRVGKVRHWGFSNFDATQIDEIIRLCEAHGWPRPIASQPYYTWLRRDDEAEHLPACIRHRIAVTPYRPLEGGLLTGKYRAGALPPSGARVAESRWLTLPDTAAFARIAEFEAEARAVGRSPTGHAIRWLLDRPGVTSLIVGVKSIEQLADTLAFGREYGSLSKRRLPGVHAAGGFMPLEPTPGSLVTDGSMPRPGEPPTSPPSTEPVHPAAIKAAPNRTR